LRGTGVVSTQAYTCPELCDGVNRCFVDPTCSTSGGAGCNAAGLGQNCRFCDTGFPAPACPAAVLQSDGQLTAASVRNGTALRGTGVVSTQAYTCPELCDGVNRCFVDPTCSTSGGVGCNAAGKGQNCRFCDTGGLAPACPAAVLQSPTTCPELCDGVNRCFVDPTCSTSPGVGCNAAGKGQDCRFCGTGGGAPACPAALLQLGPSAAELP